MSEPTAKWFSCEKCKQAVQMIGRGACPKCGAPPDDMKEVATPNIVHSENPPDGIETDDAMAALIYKVMCRKVPAAEMVAIIDEIRIERFNHGGKIVLPGYFFAEHCRWLARRLRGQA